MITGLSTWVTAALPSVVFTGTRGARTPRPSEPALRLAGVTKTYTAHDAVEAVRTIDLDVAAGEFVCVVGPRGSGTSTLLAMVAGLEPATRGRITSAGRRVRGSGPDRALLIKDAGATSSWRCAIGVSPPSTARRLRVVASIWSRCIASRPHPPSSSRRRSSTV